MVWELTSNPVFRNGTPLEIQVEFEHSFQSVTQMVEGLIAKEIIITSPPHQASDRMMTVCAKLQTNLIRITATAVKPVFRI